MLRLVTHGTCDPTINAFRLADRQMDDGKLNIRVVIEIAFLPPHCRRPWTVLTSFTLF